MLAFLPGAADIERAGAAVEEARLPLIVHRLHGQIDPAVQRRALVRDPEGRRKLILATSIAERSEEHTSELQSLMRISYAVFCLKKKTKIRYETGYRYTY